MLTEKQIRTILIRNGYRTSGERLVKKGVRKLRASFLQKMVKLEVHCPKGWLCYARSFYGQVGETEDTIRIGSVVFQKDPKRELYSQQQ